MCAHVPCVGDSFRPARKDCICRVAFGLIWLLCCVVWAEKSTFEAVGGFADKRAMEDVQTAKNLKAYGKKLGKKYGCLQKNYLVNSTRKWDDMGDWLYIKLMLENAGTLAKAALGDCEEYDRLIDKMFYDYNG